VQLILKSPETFASLSPVPIQTAKT